MSVEVDLHIHSNFSDGELSPEEIVNKAKVKGLQVISITDHDSIDGVQVTVQIGISKGLEIVPGVEISCEYKNEEIHILGYFFDVKNVKLNKVLKELQASREIRMKKMIKKANNFGFNLNYNDVIDFCEHSVPGRVHLGKALVKKGYVKNISKAFSKYLYHDGPLYEKRYKISPRDIISIIKQANGLTALAHPGLLKKSKTIYNIIDMGIQGLEVNYPLHSQEETNCLLSIAKEHSLLVTGGSDFHGLSTKNISLGDAGITMKEYEELKLF